jgi:hypothetical protein
MAVIIETNDGGSVRIIFELGEDPWVYRDAIYLTAEQRAQLTDADIETMKQERYDSWYAIANPPAPYVDPQQLVAPGPEIVELPAETNEYIEINGVKYIKANI